MITMYKLKYLPLAQQDLINIVSYISDILNNHEAALKLVNSLDNSISRLIDFPYSCKMYKSDESFNEEYRILPVKNYLVFYVVKGNEIEIHRILYSKINIDKLIN